MANLLTDEEIMNEVSIRGLSIKKKDEVSCLSIKKKNEVSCLSIKKKNKEVYIIDDCWNIIKEFAGICDYGINFKNLNTIATAKIVDIYFENSYKGYCHIDNVIQNNKVHKHGAKQLKKDVLKLVCINKNKKEMMIEIAKKTKSVKQKGIKVGDEVFIGQYRERVKVCKIGQYCIHYQEYDVYKRETKIEPTDISYEEKHTIKIYYKKWVLYEKVYKTEYFDCITDEDFKNEPMDYYQRTMVRDLRRWE
tara:strand:- start:1 stop:747 length:747 start_codon:yes stop_codon:yes gene_type:complete